MAKENVSHRKDGASDTEVKALRKIAALAARSFESDGQNPYDGSTLLAEAVRSARDDFTTLVGIISGGEAPDVAYTHRCGARLDLALALADWLDEFGREIPQIEREFAAAAE
jgi:hypothetical protein